jgi:hypothetical protein
MADELTKPDYSVELARIQPQEICPLFERALSSVRPDVVDNPYIVEALRVLPVGGYRSAIGSFWNAVVDDPRNKIIHRSLHLFNKATNISPAIWKKPQITERLVRENEISLGSAKERGRTKECRSNGGVVVA